MAALVHGNQGRAPRNRTDPAVVERLRALVGPGGRYHDFNICHLQEHLAEVEQVVLGRSTLDRLLKQARRRRERRAAKGMLVQVDGSPHAWLEDRGPRLCLLGAIDDTTGQVLAARPVPLAGAGRSLLTRGLAS